MTIKNEGIMVKNIAGGKADFYLYTELCKGCGLCIARCPKKCLGWSKETGLYQTPAVKPVCEECIACGMCELVCPDSAIRIEKK